MQILIVDDSRSVHAVAREMLSELNVQIQSLYNGQEAIEAIVSGKVKPDLILLDWEMPIKSGIEALPELHKLMGTKPILMMTSKNAMSDISEALTHGASDYIIKPYTKDILIGKITQFIALEAA